MRVLLSLAVPLLVACAVDAAPSSATATEGIVHGTPSPPEHDFAVFLKAGGGCTGSLIAPNLVLTALHCIGGQRVQASTCDAKGHQGGAVGDIALHQPPAIQVYLGAETPQQVAVGAEFFVERDLCIVDGDIALVLLDRAVTGAPLASVRSSSLPADGDSLTAIGWGLDENRRVPKHRMERSGLRVLGTGPRPAQAIPGAFNVGAELLAEPGVRQGDSGGPWLDEIGAIVGVSSRDEGGEAVISPTAHHAELIARALKSAARR